MGWPFAGHWGTWFAKDGRLLAAWFGKEGVSVCVWVCGCVLGGGRQMLVALSTPSGAQGCLIHPGYLSVGA